MKLNEADGKLFFLLFKPLLYFVNQKYRMYDLPPMNCPMDGDVAIKLADKVWKNPYLIDRYLKTRKDELSEDEQAILFSWKNNVRGKFILERHLKKGSILISMQDEKVYQVQGITSTWEEMFPGWPLPIFIEATLIPFRDVIISDGLVSTYNMRIGPPYGCPIQGYVHESKAGGGNHPILLMIEASLFGSRCFFMLYNWNTF